MKELRTKEPLASLPSTKLSAGSPASLKASVASDIEVLRKSHISFAMPFDLID